MPRVSRLRERADGVAVEVDGEQWRVLPVEVVVGAGLAEGVELDRPRLRLVRSELRRRQALTRALRVLERRDHSQASLAGRLERAGVREAERSHAVASLARAGVVDDRRFAEHRAAGLAERGYGDAAIAWRLEYDGVAAEVVAEALATLAPEHLRAEAIAARRGRGAATARLLARRGFCEDAVEAACSGVPGAE